MSEQPGREDYEAWDDAYLWHPFTPHSVYRDEEPLMVARAEGHYLIDLEGRRYLDAVASIWCNAVGHNHPHINQAIRAQLERVAHATMLGNATLPAIELAKRLVELSPEGLDRVFYSDSGSTAVEIALKMAYQYWQQVDGGARSSRQTFLALQNAYSGDTVGSVSVGGVDLFHDRFRGMLFDTLRAPSPYCYRCPNRSETTGCMQSCMQATFQMIEAHQQELAAVIVEPGLQGAGGMITYPPGFLARLRQVCDDTGTLLIFDEVAVGMGRSGELFACQREGVTPDLLCIAKMLTGGYLPLSATLASEEIFAAFLGPPEEGKTFFHGHTFTGNPLGAAAALATLEVFEREEVLARLPDKIERMAALMQSRLADLPWVGDIRQYGLAAGVELVLNKESNDPFSAASRAAYKICRQVREQGVFMRPLSANLLVFMPPLTILDEELELMVEATRRGIEAVLD